MTLSVESFFEINGIFFLWEDQKKQESQADIEGWKAAFFGEFQVITSRIYIFIRLKALC